MLKYRFLKLNILFILIISNLCLFAQNKKGLRIYGAKSENSIVFVAIEESETSKAAIKVYPVYTQRTDLNVMLPIFKNNLIQSPDLFIYQGNLNESILSYKIAFYSFLGVHYANLVFHTKIENDFLKFEKIVAEGSFYPNFLEDTILKRLE